MTGARTLFIDHAGVMGGAEFSLLDVASGFGDDAAVLLLGDGPFRAALESKGVEVEVEALGAAAKVRKAGGVSPAAMWDALRVARRVARRAAPFGRLCANTQKAFIVAAIAGWMARRPVAWILRDILAPPHFSARNVRVAVWFANRFATRVIANSKATADAFIAAGGRPELVTVVHNGIDPAPFDAIATDAALRCRGSLAIPEGMRVAIHVGRFHPWKGQQVVLEALATLRDVVAVFVGAPLFGEEAFADDLRRRAASLGVADRVKWLGFRDDVPTLMKAADVVVHSSTYPEPFGRVVVEGMLAGKPVIAARAGGVPEIVAHGRTGWLVEPGDAAALASALRGVLTDPGAAAVAARGNAEARARFTREAMVEGVRRALGARSARARCAPTTGATSAGRRA